MAARSPAPISLRRSFIVANRSPKYRRPWLPLPRRLSKRTLTPRSRPSRRARRTSSSPVMIIVQICTRQGCPRALLVANNLSGFVAHDLSGLMGHRKEVFHEPNEGATGDSADAICRGVCGLAGAAIDAGRGGAIAGGVRADVPALCGPLRGGGAGRSGGQAARPGFGASGAGGRGAAHRGAVPGGGTTDGA